jgi:hypothetical protein
MKRISEMSHEERTSLTTEEFEGCVNLECAHLGVRIPGPKPVCPEPPKAEQDVTVFCVNGVYFDNDDSARRYLQCISQEVNSIVEIDNDWKANCKIKKPLASYTRERFLQFSTERVYSFSQYEERKHTLDCYAANKTKYDALQKEWEADYHEYEKIRSDVFKVFHAAREMQEAYEKASRTFAEYLGLSDNNREQAIKFYLKAHQPSAWVLEKLGISEKETIAPTPIPSNGTPQY